MIKINMKKLFLNFLPIAVIGSLSLTEAAAQSVTSESISFNIEDVTEMFMPPDLRMNVKFVDDNKNNILEADETGFIQLEISNKGGKADNVNVSVTPEDKAYGVTLNRSLFTTSILKNGVHKMQIPMRAELNVPTGYTKFHITVSEPMGYDINATLELSTFEYQKAKIKMNGVEITDAGVDVKPYNGNPDNKLQNMDVVRATVLLQNVGDGEARSVSYKVVSKDPNIRILTMSGYAQEYNGRLDGMLVGEAKEVSFRLSPNAHYVHKGDYVPVYISVTEDMGFGNMELTQIPIPFDAATVKPELVKVEGNREKLMASLGTKVVSNDARVTSEARFKDIMVAPHGQAIHQNAVAVVIGAESYQDKTIHAAPYADRDAMAMTEYFKKSLNIKDVRTYINEDATMKQYQNIFERDGLKYSVTRGQTDLYVYYSGHGVPMTKSDGTTDVFLVPYDASRNYIDQDGYSLNKMYRELSSLGAKSVTVILDACFSGGSRASDAHESKALTNHKMILPDLEAMEQPWRTSPDFRVFTSSRGDQTSQANDKTCSGRFTYYLATGLQGDADSNGDGKILMTELVNFVTENVNKETEGQQTPQFYGNGNFVVEVIR